MRRVGTCSLLLLSLATVSLAAKPKKAAKATSAPASKQAAAAPVAKVDHLAPIAAQFESGKDLSASQVAGLVGTVEGLSLDCGTGCLSSFAASKVQNRTSRYLAVQLRQDQTAADRKRSAVWLVTFGESGKRLDAKLIEGRESADGRHSGVRTTFVAPDRFEVRSWSSFEPVKQDPTLSEATPERFKISEDGHIVEEAAGK